MKAFEQEEWVLQEPAGGASIPQLMGSEKFSEANDLEVKTRTSGAKQAEFTSNKMY